MPPRRPFLLLATLRDPAPTPDTAAWVTRVGALEQAGVDAVVLDGLPLDSMLLAALLATRTSRIGLVPVISTTTTEPFHVSTRMATVDVVSGGRAGWLAETTPAADAAGAVTWEVDADVGGDAAEHVDVVRALWDSWEEGAEVRDVASARFLDRTKVHHVHHRGRHLAVRGPSITPRPPQGHPVVIARDPAVEPDVSLGGADPGRPWLVDAGDPATIARAAADGAAGALVEGDADLPALLAELERRGVRDATPVTGTLRERFGLPPAGNRFLVPAAA